MSAIVKSFPIVKNLASSATSLESVIEIVVGLITSSKNRADIRNYGDAICQILNSCSNKEILDLGWAMLNHPNESVQAAGIELIRQQSSDRAILLNSAFETISFMATRR